MAFCPECKGSMGPTEVACPHCGYDFPDVQNPIPQRTGFAYSGLADAALLASTISAGLGCVGAIFWTVGSVANGNLAGIIVGPLACFLQLGMLVVFLRVSDLTK